MSWFVPLGSLLAVLCALLVGRVFTQRAARHEPPRPNRTTPERAAMLAAGNEWNRGVDANNPFVGTRLLYPVPPAPQVVCGEGSSLPDVKPDRPAIAADPVLLIPTPRSDMSNFQTEKGSSDTANPVKFVAAPRRAE